MKCSRCGMPLSPARTHCPRCGTAIPGKTDARLAQAPPFSLSGEPTSNAGQFGQSVATRTQSGAAWGTATPSPYTPYPESGPLAQSVPAQPHPWPIAPPLHFEEKQQSAPFASQAAKSGIAGTFPHTPERNSYFLTPKTGFTIAGVCMTLGTLILAFVFLMSQTLSQPTPSTSTRDTQTQSNQTTTNVRPDPSPTLMPTEQITPSPTVALTGQHYFSNGQLASAVNSDTAQAVTLSTSFRTGQNIYVTFQIHTGDQLGAACLKWHWGDHTNSHFEFALRGSTGNAYSYMQAAAKGPGIVEIYYASTVACSDKLLAQKIDFTVTG